MPHVAVACAVLLAVVLAVSSVSKVTGRAAFDAFAGSIARVVGRRPWVRAAAVVVVAGEAGAVVLLAVAPPAGFLLCTALMTVFSVFITVTVRSGRSVPCRCFGASGAPLTYAHLARAVLLAGAAVVGLAAARSWTWPGVPPEALVVSAAAGVGLAVPAVFLDDFLSLFAPVNRPNPPEGT